MHGSAYGLLRMPLPETVRKVSEVPVEKPCRVPRSPFLADFVLLMPANFTVGALLIPLFGQSL
jgi:hypothetical protein